MQAKGYLLTEDQAEIYPMGRDACQTPEQLISESNSRNHMIAAFVLTLTHRYNQ